MTDLVRLQTVKWMSDTVARGMSELVRDDCHELSASAAVEVENELIAAYTHSMVWDAAARDLQPASRPAPTWVDWIQQPLLEVG